MYQDVYGNHAEEHAERAKIDNLSEEYQNRLDDFSTRFQKGLVLGVGCGTGRDLGYLNGRCNRSEFIGLDASEKMIQTAESKRSNDIRFVVGDAKRLPFRDNSFDAVTCQATVFLLGEVGMEQSIEEIHRVASEDSISWISFKVSDGESSDNGIQERERWGEKVEYFFVDEEKATNLVESAGFRIEESFRTSFKQNVFLSFYLRK